MNETHVRELLETASQDIAAKPIDVDLLLAESRRSTRRRRASQLLAVSAAVAVIIAMAVVLRPEGNSSPVPSAEPSTGQLLAPPGMRLVGMNGVAVAVPGDWGMNQTRCDVAVENTVVFDKGTYRSCRLARTPDVSSVHLAKASSASGDYWKAQDARFEEVDGMRVAVTAVRPVSCGAEIRLMCTGGPAGGVVIAARDVVIWAQSPDESLVRDLLASVQLIPDGYTAVPDVAGQPEAKAREGLERAGLRALDEVTCRQSGGPWVEMCADVTGLDVPQGSVVPEGSEVQLLSSPSQFAPGARLLSERRLEIFVYGSSSCPDRPDSVESAGSNQVTVHMSEHGGPTCTADLRLIRSVVTLPAGIDTAEPVELTLVLAYRASSPYSAVLKPQPSSPLSGMAADCPTAMPELTGYYSKPHRPVDTHFKAPLLVCKYDGQRVDLDPAVHEIAGDRWGAYRLAAGTVINGRDLREVARLVKAAPPHPQEGRHIEGPDPRSPVFLRLPTTDGRYTWVWMESMVSAFSFGGQLRAVPDELIATVKKLV